MLDELLPHDADRRVIKPMRSCGLAYRTAEVQRLMGGDQRRTVMAVARQRHLDHGVTLESVASDFIKSTEFTTRYGAATGNSAFLDLLYHNVLHRDPDAPGEAFWLAALDHGVSREHVLTKTFYLLRDFPGRFNSGQTWVETLPREDDDEAASRPARGGDGVSPIIITSNDLAGAWAIRPDGQPMLPLTPGEPRQREFAFRAGVNIVMYTLTGNYKADQVHAPALIERLGQ